MPASIVRVRYRVSQDPARRAVQGASSGAPAAFCACWHRPDKFGNAICWIATFVNIRGAHEMPWVIRNTPRKPIKVFLQSGEKDLNNNHGSWPLANKVGHAHSAGCCVFLAPG